MQSSLSISPLELHERAADTDNESITSTDSTRSGGRCNGSPSPPIASPSSPSLRAHRPNSRSFRRGVGSRSVGRWRRSGGKGCSDHVPLFPNQHNPMNIVLKPYPNRRVRSVCATRGSLVTAHRNGIHVFRQRFIIPTSISHLSSRRGCAAGGAEDGGDMVDIRTGLWENVDFRSHFQLQDAYLCVAAESVFHDGEVIPLKWNRYIAAACGSDRTRYSVCVLSTSANFLLHHELHSNNRIVALNFALVAMEANRDSRRYQPFVVSVDEIGEVVIFDVERDRATKLTMCYAITTSSDGTAAADFPPKELLCEGKFTLLPACRSNGVNEGRQEPLHEGSQADTPYRLEAGLASNVCLVGPCQVLCNHCSNWSGPSPGTILLSLFISSHAHSSAGQAELHVYQLRVLYSYITHRALVVCETPIVRECAPDEVCDAGCALLPIPYSSGLPSSVLVGRPRLRFWRVSGCSGKLLHVNRVYQDKDGSGKGARTQREYFVRVVPLGRHVLHHDKSMSWLCFAALTDNDVVLLLGERPKPPASTSSTGEEVPPLDPIIKPEALTSAAEQAMLNAWLDEVEQPEAEKGKADPLVPRDDRRQGQQVLLTGESSTEAVSVTRTPLLSPADPGNCFTVLMVLAEPNVNTTQTGKKEKDNHSRVRQLLWAPQSNELLLYMGNDEDIYSIKLPFAWQVKTEEIVNKKLVDEPRRDQTEDREAGGWFSSVVVPGAMFSLGIARPLMSAMWSITGESELEQSSVSQAFQHHQEQPTHPPLENDDEKLTTRSLSAVTIDIDTNGGAITRRRKRRGMNRSSSSVFSVDASVTEDAFSCENFVDSCDDSARRAYLAGEREKFLTSSNQWCPHGTQSCVLSVETLVRVEQLASTAEPLQRNAITYEWTDTHNQLYMQFVSELNDIVEEERSRTKTSGFHGGKPPHEKQRHVPFEAFIGRPLLHDIGDCTHSAGFMRSYRSLQHKLKHVRGERYVFDFASCFASKAPPQWLLDIQEEDRCNFELADLRVAFEADMAKLVAEEIVCIYENEELVQSNGGGGRRWMSHKTFPFDDEGGEVVDIVSLNATAALGSLATVGAEPQWRWATEETVPSRCVGSKLAHKRLHQWTIGEWMYAPRWPTREEEKSAKFLWSSKNSNGTAGVRRRRLTRKRIDIAVEAAREERRREYEKEVEELREELGF
ncbi:hypothetical protein DPX39_070065800 [Trypanosoma brucei equiperdum]|uniref:Uncharacterized protein n=1 Tax=Trypanosoma brucei equiperdum TaxID=630700 RepID=A0A3L6L457_9TRYP|nr:hypothetical protein DPX39_070065800 [Trypanosoma brucei equiperdum]